MGVHRYLDASTAYITEGDNQILTDGIAVPYAPSDYGWWVWAGEVDGSTDPFWRTYGLSEAFIALLVYARQQGCRYVNVDRDGDDDLPLQQHEW